MKSQTKGLSKIGRLLARLALDGLLRHHPYVSYAGVGDMGAWQEIACALMSCRPLS